MLIAQLNTGQVPACSQEPVDLLIPIMWRLQLAWRQHSKKRQISLSDYCSNRTGSCSAAPLSVQNSYPYKNILRIRKVLEHRIDAKISPKAPSEKAQTTVSENRYTSPKINVFQMAILSLLAPTGNTTSGRHFWYSRYRIPPLQSCGITESLHSFPSAFWASEYTCCPIIANLLYM